MSSSATTDQVKEAAKGETSSSRARGLDARASTTAKDPEPKHIPVSRKAAFNWQQFSEALAKPGEKFRTIVVKLDNPAVFIDAVRVGVPGEVVKSAIKTFGNDRELFVRLLGTSSSNLSRFYVRKALDPGDSEAVLDAIRVLNQATDVFEDRGMALEWLQSRVPALAGARPLDLFDTAEGRNWVRAALRNIEHGDFT
jgi:putative toxin-antitoxin system antitoxin component (TIGR02293 family)